MMKMIFFWLLVVPMISFADDPKNGVKLYKNCVQCHGPKGEGVKDQEGPKIGGQHDWYLEVQIKNFKSGKRSNPKMMPYIKNLSDNDIKDLSLYLSTLKK
jgi:cytochrome c553